MSAESQPSYEELAAENAVLRELVAALELKIGNLAARLNQNSKNSSKPPSSDSPFVKPAPKSLRGKSGRRPGGQAGHQGGTLRQVARPDRIVRHRPKSCGGCGTGPAGFPESGVDVRRVFDIPGIAVTVTGHPIATVRCACGRETAADAPDGVNAPVSYGPNTAAITVHLYSGQFLPRRRTADALSELFGTPLCAGTVTTMTRRAARALRARGVLEKTGAGIAAAPVANFDETGLRVAGAPHRVHSASTGRFSLPTAHPRRGTAGMDHAGVLPGFHGVAVHDARAPYDTYEDAGHALCSAHAARELVAVFETAAEGAWNWARQAHDALLDLKNLVADAVAAGRHEVDPALRDDLVHRLHTAALIGAEIAGGGAQGAKHRALARGLRDRQGDCLRFLEPGFAVPWDNNAAEREVRMVKVRQKVSECMRTLDGARDFTDIRSHLATAAKHGIRFIDALTTLAERRPWLPQTV